MLIHQTLSPFCLFTLASENNNNIALQTPSDVAAGRQWQGGHFAKPSPSPNHTLVLRNESFRDAPNGPPTNLDALIRAGFYYEARSESVSCFYCHRRTEIPVEYLRSTNPWPMPEHHAGCAYYRQMNDEDPFNFNRSSQSFSAIRSLFIRIDSSLSVSTRCGWCEKKPLRCAAFPCKHLSMCETCCHNRLCCPRCFLPFDDCAKIYL